MNSPPNELLTVFLAHGVYAVIGVVLGLGALVLAVWMGKDMLLEFIEPFRSLISRKPKT